MATHHSCLIQSIVYTCTWGTACVYISFPAGVCFYEAEEEHQVQVTFQM